MTSTRIRRRGLLLVFSSPSGAGKTTIARRLVEQDPGLALSVSVTTRPPRPGEVDGRDYWFIDQTRFDEMAAQGEFLEHARVFGHCYGTPRRPIDEALAAGHRRRRRPRLAGKPSSSPPRRGRISVAVFVLPPSLAALEKRLRARAQDSAATVAARMAKSAEEMSHWPEYDYVIVNDTVEQSIAQAQAIVTAERLRRPRQTGLDDFVDRLRKG